MKKKNIALIFLTLILLISALPVAAQEVDSNMPVSAGMGIQPLEAISVLADGNYYLNSSVTGTFLQRETATSLGLTEYISDGTIKWNFEKQTDGSFIIRSVYQSTYALYGSGSSVSLALLPTSPTANYKWNVYNAVGGGVLVENAGNGDLLYYNGYSLTLAAKPSSSSINYDNAVWRLPGENYYVNMTNFNISYGESPVNVGSTKACTITATPTNSTWRHSGDYIWNSSNTNIATVSASGVVTGLSMGTTVITATHKATGLTSSVSVTIRGPAYISMYDLRKTMTYLSGDVCLMPFEGFSFDEWIITEQNGGYYTIQSAETDEALAVSAGSLVLQTYQPTNTAQHWSFIEGAYGRYKICSASGVYLCYGETGSMITPVTVGTDQDLWTIIYSRDASLLALPSDQDRSSYFGEIAEDLDTMGYSDVYNNHTTRAGGVSLDELLCYMANSKITLIRTHGSQNSIQTTDSYLTKEYLQDLDNEFLFEKSELIIYAACLTAQGGEYADNIMNATLDCGARSVIGFETVTNTFATNEWSPKFFEKLSYYSANNSASMTLTGICDEIDEESQSAVYAEEYEFEEYFDYILDGIEVSLRTYVVVGVETLPGIS